MRLLNIWWSQVRLCSALVLIRLAKAGIVVVVVVVDWLIVLWLIVVFFVRTAQEAGESSRCFQSSIITTGWTLGKAAQCLKVHNSRGRARDWHEKRW
jgi:hypothetical protein